MKFAMKTLLAVVVVAGLMALPVRATDEVVSAIHGTITKLDSATRTAVVKTADGTEHTIHFVDKTAVHGAEATATGSKDAFHGLKEGSEVAVHYTEKGGDKTAVEVDHLGKDTKESAEAIAKGADKTGKVTVYYTESAGKKVAHFFKKL